MALNATERKLSFNQCKTFYFESMATKHKKKKIVKSVSQPWKPPGRGGSGKKMSGTSLFKALGLTLEQAEYDGWTAKCISFTINEFFLAANSLKKDCTCKAVIPLFVPANLKSMSPR